MSKPPEDAWSAFCGLCRTIVAEGTEAHVRAVYEAHRAEQHHELTTPSERTIPVPFGIRS